MASLPEFIEAGMAFFRGETVPVSKLTEARERISELEGRAGQLSNDLSASRKELETAAGIVIGLTKACEGHKASIEAKDATIQAQAKQISDLEANYQTAARQAQQQIAQAGAAAPVNVEAPKNQEGEKTEADQFISEYKALISGGKAPSVALSELARTKSALHVAFIKSGKNLS